MSKIIKTLVLFLFISAGEIAFSQTDKETALSKGQEGIKLIDEGKPDEAIVLLKEAQKLDPSNMVYPYEIALANIIKGDYEKGAKILEKTKKYKDVNDQVYQQLGNCYDMMGEKDKAFDAYDEGLEKFPNSGCIYLEKGNVYFNDKEYLDALQYYEKGIKVQPEFPLNYFKAALIFLGSDEEVWGMIYGEIFMNLERNTDRTGQMSKILYDVYKREIDIISDTEVSVSFSKGSINVNDLIKGDEIKLPYGTIVYETTLSLAVAGEIAIDINSLDRIRKKFIEIYFQNDNNEKYPNALFDYENEILKAGYMEEYNHWILMDGNKKDFDAWRSANEDEWDNFLRWFSDNPIKLDKTNRFYREQY